MTVDDFNPTDLQVQDLLLRVPAEIDASKVSPPPLSWRGFESMISRGDWETEDMPHYLGSVLHRMAWHYEQLRTHHPDDMKRRLTQMFDVLYLTAYAGAELIHARRGTGVPSLDDIEELYLAEEEPSFDEVTNTIDRAVDIVGANERILTDISKGGRGGSVEEIKLAQYTRAVSDRIDNTQIRLYLFGLDPTLSTRRRFVESIRNAAVRGVQIYLFLNENDPNYFITLYKNGTASSEQFPPLPRTRLGSKHLVQRVRMYDPKYLQELNRGDGVSTTSKENIALLVGDIHWMAIAFPNNGGYQRHLRELPLMPGKRKCAGLTAVSAVEADAHNLYPMRTSLPVMVDELGYRIRKPNPSR